MQHLQLRDREDDETVRTKMVSEAHDNGDAE